MRDLRSRRNVTVPVVLGFALATWTAPPATAQPVGAEAPTSTWHAVPLAVRAEALTSTWHAVPLAVRAEALTSTTRAAQASTAPAAIRLTLDEAIALAVAASHRVGEGKARQDAAAAAVDGREAATMPVVSVMAGYTRTNHVVPFGIPPENPTAIIFPDIPDNFRTRVDMQWPVYTFGRFESLERAARSEAAAAEQDVATITADVRFDAARAFWTLVTAAESVRVVQEALALVEAHLRDVQNMRAAGLLAPNDVLSVEAERSRRQVQLVEARNMRDVAEADLRRVTGIAPGTAISIDAVLEGPAAGVSAYDALLADARAHRSERYALQARVDALGGRRDAAAAGLKPVLAVGAGFDYAKPNPEIFPRTNQWHTSWDVGVNFSWPLWDGGRVKADVAEAAATQRAVEQRLAEFDSVLEFEVRQRQLDVESAREAIRAATDEVAAAAEARRVVAERFEAGLVSTTEVLDAQQALLVAQFDRTRALAGARLAEARLDRALGR
jgi:outer membrane protein TolC